MTERPETGTTTTTRNMTPPQSVKSNFVWKENIVSAKETAAQMPIAVTTTSACHTKSET